MKKSLLPFLFLIFLILGSACSKEESNNTLVQITVVKDNQFVDNHEIIVLDEENLDLFKQGRLDFVALKIFETNNLGMVTISLMEDDFFAESDKITLGFLSKDTDESWKVLLEQVEVGVVYTIFFHME